MAAAEIFVHYVAGTVKSVDIVLRQYLKIF